MGIARATKGDVTPAGEKFREILRQISSEADRDKSNRFLNQFWEGRSRHHACES
jgi:hypothetical protein